MYIYIYIYLFIHICIYVYMQRGMCGVYVLVHSDSEPFANLKDVFEVLL